MKIKTFSIKKGGEKQNGKKEKSEKESSKEEKGDKEKEKEIIFHKSHKGQPFIQGLFFFYCKNKQDKL